MKFEDYKIHKEILKALHQLGYEYPTEVQTLLIPILGKQQDSMVKAKTGSGKTAAFAIPILNQIEWDVREPQVLVLTPTRELALQVQEEIFHIGRYKRVKVEAIYGKVSFDSQAKRLHERVHVVVGTPGRILDHIQRKTLSMSEIGYVVIDEADEMFEVGFEEQVKQILDGISTGYVLTLLSATLTPNIENLCKDYMTKPVYIEAKEDSMLPIKEYYIEGEDKGDLLYHALVNEETYNAIIFCNTKEEVNQVYESLKQKLKLVGKLHGDMDQKDRIQTMKEFKLGYIHYLVASDVAARGIDVDQIELVVNYNVPTNYSIYTHRIGRTGRMNREGKALTLVSKEEQIFFQRIKKVNQQIEPYEIETEIWEAKEERFLNQEKRRSIKIEKGSVFKDEIMKLHINAGKKVKLRSGDVVGAICSIEGVSSEDIGVIEVIDVATFVEILNQKGAMVLAALQDIKIKGKLRKVSKVKLTRYEKDYLKQEKCKKHMNN